MSKMRDSAASSSSPALPSSSYTDLDDARRDLRSGAASPPCRARCARGATTCAAVASKSTISARKTGPPIASSCFRVGQVLGERHEVDGVLLVVERDHRLVERRVGRVVEVVGLHLLGDVDERARVEQERREHRALGVEVVGRDAPRDRRSHAHRRPALAAHPFAPPSPPATGNQLESITPRRRP